MYWTLDRSSFPECNSSHLTLLTPNEGYRGLLTCKKKSSMVRVNIDYQFKLQALFSTVSFRRDKLYSGILLPCMSLALEKYSQAKFSSCKIPSKKPTPNSLWLLYNIKAVPCQESAMKLDKMVGSTQNAWEIFRLPADQMLFPCWDNTNWPASGHSIKILNHGRGKPRGAHRENITVLLQSQISWSQEG